MSREPSWLKLSQFLHKAPWTALQVAGDTLSAAVYLMFGHRLSLTQGQRVAYMIIAGCKSSIYLASSSPEHGFFFMDPHVMDEQNLHRTTAS